MFCEWEYESAPARKPDQVGEEREVTAGAWVGSRERVVKVL